MNRCLADASVFVWIGRVAHGERGAARCLAALAMVAKNGILDQSFKNNFDLRDQKTSLKKCGADFPPPWRVRVTYQYQNPERVTCNFNQDV